MPTAQPSTAPSRPQSPWRKALRNWLPVARLLGALIVGFSVTMLVPMGVSWWARDGMARVFAFCAIITAAAGTWMWWKSSDQPLRRLRSSFEAELQPELQPRHGILLVVLVWCVLPLFAMWPIYIGLWLLDRPVDLAHAFYEAVSGLSTSGGTALMHIDQLPVSINFWRCLLQWQGGMGILVLVVAVLPMLGMGGAQLFMAESVGPMKEARLTPRITATAKGLWSVYATLSLLCATAYWAAGMPVLDAIMHMFTTVSLGGFSSHDASIGHYQSATIELVAIVTMLAASCNFALYFSAVLRRKPRTLLSNPELRMTLALLLGGGLGVSLLLWVNGMYAFDGALRHGAFQTISIATTTGFVSTNFEPWPPFAAMLMLLLSCFATSAGSTGGGIKLLRVLVLVQLVRYELNHMIHPQAVQPPHIGPQRIPNHVVRAVVAFAVLYVGTVCGMTVLFFASGLDLFSAFGTTLASINCAGLGLGKTGPASNYLALDNAQVLLSCLGMVLGRLELLSFFALLVPSFWRR